MTARSRTPNVLLFGEALVGYGTVEPTLRTATQFTRFPGGADLNVAVGLSRLGVRATWASVLGDDAHGDYLADAIAQLGITALAARATGPTALMFKAGGGDRDPEVLQVRHRSAFAQHADAVLTGDIFGMGDTDHLHLTGITLGISPVARLQRSVCWRLPLRPESVFRSTPTFGSTSGRTATRCSASSTPSRPGPTW
jgi:sugar/nucleoside kinase (ribokinase family)